MTKTWAAPLIPENFPEISAACAKEMLDVDYDQLDADFDDAEYYSIDQIYAVLSYNTDYPGNACYTAQWDLDFDKNWRFTGEVNGIWKRIELIQS